MVAAQVVPAAGRGFLDLIVFAWEASFYLLFGIVAGIFAALWKFCFVLVVT